MAVSHVKSNPVANMTGTVTVFNSAGVTTTAAATDLVRPLDWNSAHNQFITIGGNTAGASTLSGTNIEFHGGNNVTLSGDGQTIVFSAPTQTAFVLSNSNGMTFGTNGSTVTASHNGLTTARASNDAIGLNSAFTAGPLAMTINSSGLSLNAASAAGTTSGFTGGASISGSMTHNTAGLAISLSHPAWITTAALSNHSHGNPTLALTNLSGTTASNSAGLTLSLSAAAGAADGGIGISAGANSQSNGTVVLSNSNGMSFGLNASTITASYTVPSATVTVNAVSNTTQNSSGTVNLSGLSFQGAGVASVGLSNGSVVISVPSGGGAGDGGNVIAAGTQTGTSLGTIKFENSPFVSFGMSGSTQVTASHNGLTTAAQSDHSHGNPTLALTNLNGTTASASNGLTLSLSAAAQSVQPVAVSGQNGSYAFSTLSLSNANGISFGTSGASAITASHNGLTSQSNQALSGSNGSFTFQTATFGNLNGVSFYTSNGSLVASHNGLTTARASNDAIGLNSAFTAGPLAMTINSSGLSLNAASAAGTTSGFAGNLISGSMTHNTAGLNLSLNHPAWLTTAAQSNHSHGNPSLALTNLSGTTASNSAGLTISLSAAAGGGATPVASASNGSFSFTTLGFSNANNVTFGTSAGNIITASVAAPGAAAEQNAINLLGANTSGNTTATGSTIGLSGLNLTLSGTNASQVVISAPATSSLVGSGGISLSTNGSTITISYTGGAGGGVTFSGFNPYADLEKIAGQYGQGTLQFDPVRAPDFVMDRVVIPVINTNSSNSSGSHTLSFWVGLYSRNASTLSLVQSTSSSIGITHSGTAGSYSLYSGNRVFTIPLTTTITQGDYWLGFVSRTTSGGANGSYSHLIASNIASNFLGIFGSSNNTTQQMTLGQGLYTATTSGMPSSVAFSQIRGSDSAARRAAFVMFAQGTV